MFHLFREMHAHADGTASVVREMVPPDAVVRTRAADAGIEFSIRAHPFEYIILNHRSRRMVIGKHADSAAIFKTAIFDRNSVRISNPDDIRADGPEGTTGDLSALETAHIEADEAVFGILTAPVCVRVEGKAGKGYPAEIAVRHFEEGGRHRGGRLLHPHQAVTRQFPAKRDISVDIVHQSVTGKLLAGEIDIAVLDFRHGTCEETVPGRHLNIQFPGPAKPLSGLDPTKFLLRIDHIHDPGCAIERRDLHFGSHSHQDGTLPFNSKLRVRTLEAGQVQMVILEMVCPGFDY